MANENVVDVEIINSSLQDRLIYSPYRNQAKSWILIYLQFGTLQISQSDLDTPLSVYEATSVVLHPVSSAQTLKLLAGSVATYLVFDENSLSAILGVKPEAVELRAMTANRVALDLANRPNVEMAVSSAFTAAILEDENNNPCRDTIVEAQARCILIHLWRYCALPSETQSSDAAQTLMLRRFRQLVEQHFRDRWRVTDYARELGTTPDRLHNLTNVALDRSPLALIHERSMREAKALLERSNLTVQQISAFLGFHSAAQFSNFFAHHQSIAPGKYRRQQRNKNTRSEQVDVALADWP